MKKSIIILILSLSYSALGYCQITGTYTDQRDGKLYYTTEIGNQTWFSQNLDTQIFRNGDTIYQALTSEEWISACETEKPAWCYFMFKEKNGKNFGKLYNWYAVKDERGLAPEGWVIPELSDWEKLLFYVGFYSAHKLKSAYEWTSNYGSNEYKFTIEPSGIMVSNGEFTCKACSANFWTKTPKDSSFVNTIGLDFNDIELEFQFVNLWCGLSVRCVKDE